MSTQGQPTVVTYSAYNRTTVAMVSGDQANHTLKLIVDGVEGSLTGAATALSNGEYAVALSGGQNAGVSMSITGASSTANVAIAPAKWMNEVPRSGGGPLAYSVFVTTNGVTKLVGASVRLVSGSTSVQATSDTNGFASFGLRSGTWTVLATADGYSYAPTTIVVSADGQTTITMTAASVPPATNASQTTAYLVTRDGSGLAVGGVTVTIALVDPESLTDAWSRRNITATSDLTGLLQVPLRKLTMYRARVDKGDWIPFETGSATTYALPEMLGIQGS